jgi:hypothetical protein
MNVKESMAAYRDGTFEKNAKDDAERRETAKERNSKGGVQKGRDLYESMYPTKKEQ